ncbi:hypothetical protein B9J93_20670 [Vibrio sp. V17_P4S1T151]|uniref:hypothetical protein n=1 Tax=unclassified Vibrio TaxID=2614977 RepID=UPI000B8ED3F2|nr:MULTISPECIES: hypothetical protein [unclassified Vibrio]OXX41074.1 hypothetical protein B9J93_20670 [Vibrio sp. V17_P4S1T151]OXX61341.1 hypothetical protein B9J89_14435 [Vibrio sp. V15_P4S5T153]
MPQIANKLMYSYGALVSLIGLPFALYLSLEDLLNVYKLGSKTIELSYFFAISPILFWILGIVIVGTYSLFFNKRMKLSQPMRKAIGIYTPIVAVSLSLAMGIFLKPLMADHLVAHGYTLEKTISASAPWRSDIDVYTRNGQ